MLGGHDLAGPCYGWGNITSRGDGIASQYDALGNLRWVNKGSSSQIAYTYDGDGVRVLSVSADGKINKLEFTGSDGLLYQEINLASNTPEDHVYLGRSKLVDVQGATRTWYHSDPAGSPLAGTDASGKLLWRTHYRPYGEKLEGATADNQQWFTGKPFEDKIGLSYFGARWYDPVLGRFMAIDPVDWVDSNPVHSFNRYGYANNNPLRFVDPDGRESVGTLIDQKATEAAERGDVASTYGWAFAGTSWSVFGAESLSQLASQGQPVTFGLVVGALFETAQALPGGQLTKLGKAAQLSDVALAFKDYNQARNAALQWLESRGFAAEKATIGKFGENAGAPVGMQTIDGKIGFRVEFDVRLTANFGYQA